MTHPKRSDAWKTGEANKIIKWHVENGVPMFIIYGKKRKALMPKTSDISNDALEKMKHDFFNEPID